jgi:mRNA interferase HigB
MVVIGRGVAENAFERHGRRADIGACRRQVARWIEVVGAAAWRHMGDVKQQFRSADPVGRNVVFNISGNDYRLVARLHFAAGVAEIKFLGTHREYDALPDIGGM